MNATQSWRAARPQTSSDRYRKAAFAGFAAAAIVCGPVAGQDGPEDIGEWKFPPITGPLWGFDHDVYVMHAAHLPDGSILVWKLPPDQQPFLWDPMADTLTEMPTGFNVGCTGHAGLPDGTLLLAGGIPPTTETKIFSFEGSPLGPWQLVDSMTDARFYPTLTTLPDGRVLATAGRDDGGMAEPVLTFEIFDPGEDPPAWGDIVDIPTDGIGIEYPHMFVVPDADPNVHKVFFSSSYFPAEFNTEEVTYMLDVGAETWTPVGGDPPFHAWLGSAVMYEPGKVLKCGGKEIVGGQGILDNTATIDLNDPMPAWQAELPMTQARRDHNLVLLPDGKILAVGGIDPAPVLVAEWFDPATGFWLELDAMDFERGDHSTAVLLADGRVLSAGGHTETAEIFSPPYLFKAGGLPADRPEVGFAPTAVAYGTSFNVVLSSASPVSRDDIEKVTLLRLGAGTHSIDMNQRYMSLPVQTVPARPNALTVEAPDNGTFAPPGYYMLFLISVDGVPSIAKYVRLYEASSP